MHILWHFLSRICYPKLWHKFSSPPPFYTNRNSFSKFSNKKHPLAPPCIPDLKMPDMKHWSAHRHRFINVWKDLIFFQNKVFYILSLMDWKDLLLSSGLPLFVNNRLFQHIIVRFFQSNRYWTSNDLQQVSSSYIFHRRRCYLAKTEAQSGPVEYIKILCYLQKYNIVPNYVLIVHSKV